MVVREIKPVKAVEFVDSGWKFPLESIVREVNVHEISPRREIDRNGDGVRGGGETVMVEAEVTEMSELKERLN